MWFEDMIQFSNFKAHLFDLIDNPAFEFPRTLPFWLI